jgi:hypothetical protein
MGAILYAPRYGDNVVNYSDRHRKSFIHCRALAHQIMRHLQLSSQLKSSSGRLNKVSSVYLYFLVEQVQSFWLQRTMIQPSPNNPGCVDAIAEAIARCFHGKEQFWKRWAKFSQPEARSSLRYGFHGKHYTVIPPIHAMEVGCYLSKGKSPHPTAMQYCSSTPLAELFDPEGKTPLEEEEDDDGLDPEMITHIAEIKGWANA